MYGEKRERTYRKTTTAPNDMNVVVTEIEKKKDDVKLKSMHCAHDVKLKSLQCYNLTSN